MPFAAPAPPPDDDLGQLADLIVTWSGLVLAGFALLMSVLTILFVAAGFVGIRELRSIRETGQRARRELDEQKRVAGEILDEGNRAVQAAEALSVEANELLDRARTAAEVTETQSESIRQLNVRLQTQISDLDQRVSTIVEVSYLFNQGEAAYRTGQYEKAIEFLQRALELDPKNTRVRYRLGRSLTNLGRDAEAAHELRAAIDGGLLRDRGERALAYLYRYTDPNAAHLHADRATEAGPDHATNWNCLGLLRRDSGDFAGSRDAHLRAYELDPTLITTPFYLALLAAQMQAFPQARERSTEAMNLLEEGERRAKIKNIWAAVIRWSDTVLRGSYDDADRYAAELTETCPSARRAQEICDHMEFLLRALSREQHRERYVGTMERIWLTGAN
ncbi:tetratricopeptide repeat protein [Jidongwangia harbinensis]|uniref:tetratricopeptide repeat protein n=1 Tax=Jidongwangia harbinensis TaxID=2878561 RepID=UPI001CDA299F|nr:tetratricopeptide repeat protein [Jidongwangia harbinensis]MCA2217835.1 tetratricopeptide repeat protein [Jidongwangia harbinensis]